MKKEKILKNEFGLICYGVYLEQSEKCSSDIRLSGTIELRRVAALNKNEAYKKAKNQMMETLGIICVLKNGDKKNSIFPELEEYWPEYAQK